MYFNSFPCVSVAQGRTGNWGESASFAIRLDFLVFLDEGVKP